MNEKARERALMLLNRRDYSRKMLIDKITEKGFTQGEAEEVADSLCALGFINDERYAGLVVRHYAAKGYGAQRIKQELFRRGIEKELWDGALAELPEADDRIESFIRTRLRGQEPSRENLQKIIAALQRRGYSWTEIEAAVEHIRENGED